MRYIRTCPYIPIISLYLRSDYAIHATLKCECFYLTISFFNYSLFLWIVEKSSPNIPINFDLNIRPTLNVDFLLKFSNLSNKKGYFNIYRVNFF